MDLLITGHLLLPDANGTLELAEGSLIVRRGRIESIAPRIHASPDFGGPDFLITPGFVDAHVHLPQFDSIGVDGLELLTWLDRAVFPAELKWADVGYAAAMCERVARELLSFGTANIAAYATVHHESAQAAIEVCAKAGLSGYIGQVLMDRNAPKDLCRPARESVASASRLRAIGRIAPAVTPRFAVACTRELLNEAGKLAKATNWHIQTHLSETQPEIDLVGQLFPGRSYLEVYKDAGLLTPRTLLAHGVWLDSDDLATVAKTGAIVAHCPTANRFLMAGEMDRERTLRSGALMALGSDVAGGPDRSMVRVARAMLETQRQLGYHAKAGPAAWSQITRWNAALLGLSDTGELKPGNTADLLVIRPTTQWLSSHDPLSHLLYAWDDRWLRATITGGEVRWQA
ncbi:MAG TPA: amidohydrolase family protein [Phycisphaerales bacterium]|nr:amidohydrolase family protein [Phycisphaerales bacterium]